MKFERLLVAQLIVDVVVIPLDRLVQHDDARDGDDRDPAALSELGHYDDSKRGDGRRGANGVDDEIDPDSWAFGRVALVAQLALSAGLLLTVFDGITDRLIPLFAIGAFLTFTISQAGMVVHWRRELRDKRHAAERRRVWINLVINAIGASTTVTALGVIVVAKFAQGGWITIVAIPCVIVLHKAIKRYYDDIDDQLRDKEPLKFHQSKPPIVLVTVQEWNRIADKVLGLAMELSSDVAAVRLAALEGPDVEGEERKLREQWAKDVEEPARAAHYPMIAPWRGRAPCRPFDSILVL